MLFLETHLRLPHQNPHTSWPQRKRLTPTCCVHVAKPLTYPMAEQFMQNSSRALCPFRLFFKIIYSTCMLNVAILAMVSNCLMKCLTRMLCRGLRLLRALSNMAVLKKPYLCLVVCTRMARPSPMSLPWLACSTHVPCMAI